MPIKITRGIERAPLRAVVYGVEGIGKSTLASQFPDALVLDTEDGTRHLDVARSHVDSWQTLMVAVRELVLDAQGFRTVVIDSADWAERLLIDHVLQKAGKNSIEDFGFGKGYVLLAEQYAKLLGACDQLVATGVNVVLVAHAHVKRVSPPDQNDGYDRYELKLTKQTAPLLKEWSDLLLFCTYDLQLVEGADGRKKARGGKRRIMYAERAAAWDAKNRFGLPESMPLGIEPIQHLWDTPAASPAAGGGGPVTSPPALKTEPPIDVAKVLTQVSRRIAKAETVEALEDLRARVNRRQRSGDISEDQAGALTEQIDGRMSALTQEVDA